MSAESDYYSNAPLVSFDRPLVLLAWMPGYAREVGRRIAAVLGLPFADLDRLVEHFSGCSIAHLLAEEGESTFREVERECLEDALRDSPKGVLSIGDGALMEPGSLDLVLGGANLVALDLDLPNLYWKIRALVSSGELAGWPFPFEPPPDGLDDLRPRYIERRPAFDAAHHRLEVRALGPGAAALRLMAMVPGLRT